MKPHTSNLTPHTYFMFRRFTIHQDRCAMKVSTDSCLFGAWVADELMRREASADTTSKINTILEIGTGTGLLSLMVAQKTNAIIDTVEIDAEACSQAKENIAASEWNQRINLICGDVKNLTEEKKYDCIISNPPFFENQLRSGNKGINVARHEEALNLEDLLNVISRKLSPRGSFIVLLPYYRADYFANMAADRHFHLLARVNIKQSTKHQYFRSILQFGKNSAAKTKLSELTIKDEDNYSENFIALLKDYYLNL